jgi:ABC-type phosphate transport system substrate-binding protein
MRRPAGMKPSCAALSGRARLGWGLWAALAGLLVFMAVPTGAQDDGYVVIVHPGVPVDHVTKGELGRLFQRRTTQWSDGSTVIPVEEAGPVRARFYRETMRMSVAEVGNYWVRQAMTTAVQPPRLLGSADLVIAYVAANPGAVAFVESSAHLGTRVKRVSVE